MLLTKLHIPSPSKDIVHRRVLYERLNTSAIKKLTIVSAPAGYGKTTLISDWIHQNKVHVAWLSIDGRDDETTVFIDVVLSSLQTINKKIGESARAILNSPNSDKKYILELLINDIVKHQEDIILVIDDFHLIHNETIFELLGFFLDYLPDNFHIVLSTRSDPPLNTARLRSRNEFTEIRAADLSFSENDISDYFNKRLKFNLDKKDIRTLESKTEGWVAGLQLAAMSFQGKYDVSESIKKMSADNRYFVDYLMEEVLNGQSDEIRSFLLKTSILKRFSGALCNAVLELNDCATLLETLEKNNMFLVSLDDERKWFRYHHLFANLLKQRLANSFSEEISALHSNASKWYLQNGFEDEAIEHLFAIGEYEKTTALIINQFDKIWESGQHYKFEHWLNLLPSEVILSKSQLLILQAETLITHWKNEEAQDLLEKAEQLLNKDSNSLSQSYLKNIKGRIAANYALLFSFKEDVEKVLFYSKEAQNLLSEEETTWHSLAAITMGDAYFLNGDFNAAYNAQLKALKLCEQSGNHFLTLIANANIAVTLRQLGKLKKSLEICRQQIQFANKKALSHSVVVGWLYTIMGEILCEFNRAGEAVDNVQKGIIIIDKCGDSGMLFKSYLLLTRILFSQGNLKKAEETVDKLQTLAQESSVTRNIESLIKAWQNKIHLAQNGMADSKIALPEDEENVNGDFLFIEEVENLSIARVYFEQGHSNESLDLLDGLIGSAESGNRVNSLIEMYLLKALIYNTLNKESEAREYLLQSLVLAEPGGYCRVFIEDEALFELIKGIIKDKSIKSTDLLNEISIDYLKNLRLAYELEKRKIKQPTGDLSKRELEILNLIVKKLSNKEISETLYISLNTVKSHISNILLKLGAKNRIEAIEIVKQKGIT